MGMIVECHLNVITLKSISVGFLADKIEAENQQKKTDTPIINVRIPVPMTILFH